MSVYVISNFALLKDHATSISIREDEIPVFVVFSEKKLYAMKSVY